LLNQGFNTDDSVTHMAASIHWHADLLGEFLADTIGTATLATDAYGICWGGINASSLAPFALPAAAGTFSDLSPFWFRAL
jgi:hypothetical protein